MKSLVQLVICGRLVVLAGTALVTVGLLVLMKNLSVIIDPGYGQPPRKAAPAWNDLQHIEHRLHETLEAEATGVFSASPRQGALRRKVNDAVTDRWRIVAGAELLEGDSLTLFDLFRDASSMHTEVRFGF